MTNEQSSQKRLGAALFYGIVILLMYLTYLVFAPFLVPLAWAAVLVVVSYPAYEWLARRWGPVMAAIVSTLAVLIYEFEPRRAFADFSGTPDGLALTAVAVVATFIAVRVVVARPQPLTNPGLVAIDDAVRTQAVHTLAGAGIAVALLGTSACLFEMGGYASPEWLHITGVIAAIGSLVGTVAAWTFRGSPWRVERSTLR